MNNIDVISATGGGAYKFNNLILQELNVKMEKHDELVSLVHGYILMNSYNTFYELDNGNVKYLDQSDFVF